jgi:hypothetical protein
MNSKYVAIGMVAIVATLVVATFAVTGQNAFAFHNHQSQHVHSGCGDTCNTAAQQSQNNGAFINSGNVAIQNAQSRGVHN